MSMSEQARGVGPSISRSTLGHPVVVVAIVVVVTALGYVWSAQQPESYTATTRLFLSSSSSFDPVGTSGYVNDPNRYAINQAGLARSTPVLEQAIAEGDLSPDVEDLRDALAINAGRGTDVIVIEATAPSPTDAADWANAVAAAYRSFNAEQVAQETEALLELSTNEADRATLLKHAAAYGDGVALAEPAVVPDEPSAPRPLRDGLIAAVVGLVLGVLVAVAIDAARALWRLHRRAAGDPWTPLLDDKDPDAPREEDDSPEWLWPNRPLQDEPGMQR
jgi:uncharacterized protein involved in exopolysaccharide biosynthesis